MRKRPLDYCDDAGIARLRAKLDGDRLAFTFFGDAWQVEALLERYDAAIADLAKLKPPAFAHLVIVADALLPELQEWSEPVRVKVANRDDQRVELLFERVPPQFRWSSAEGRALAIQINEVTTVAPGQWPGRLWIMPLLPNTGGVVNAYFHTEADAERVRAWLEEAK